MGMIYKRGKTWWVKYYRNGKPYRESTRSHKEADAKKLLKKREGEISQGKLPGIYFDKVRFDELADDFLRDRRINRGESSAKGAEKRLKHLRPIFGDIRVTRMTSAKINEYIDQRMEEGAMNGTINRELSALRRMLNLGARQTPPKVDRVPFIPQLKENNIRKGFFEDPDFLALKDALPSYLWAVVTFAYKTGWRKSEIVNLTWSRVDLQQGIIRLEPGETKNDEGRTYYLDSELKHLFKELWGQRALGCPYVFHRNGKKIGDFRYTWNKACEAVGISSKLFHDFRRTAVRNMVRSGIPESVAMAISGHKTNTVFKRYDIVSPEDLKRASRQQEAYLEAQRQGPARAQMGTISGTIDKSAVFHKRDS